MKNRALFYLVFLFCGTFVLSQTLWAHGYQTAPYSRIANAVDSGQKAQLNYNPNQISNNLPNSLGTRTLQQITDYVSQSNGMGPLAFFKDYYPIQNNTLCAFSANNQGFLPLLNNPLPDNKMTSVSSGDLVQFKWGYSAWHAPSNNFVFVTQYPAGQYKANPSWNDLHFVCAVAADANGAWQCTLPAFNGDAKQVMVTIWQRVDAAGENFISCADVKVANGTVVPPEKIWSFLGNSVSWTAGLINAPKVGDTVNFTLETQNKSSAQKSLLATYALPITATNLAQWESILAAKVNNDSTHAKVVAIGQLNSNQGQVVYNNGGINYVYLNNTIASPLLTYSYTLTVTKAPLPVAEQWQQIGEPLKVWINTNTVKANDKLQFALQIAGVEQVLNAITVNNVAEAEQLIAEQVNKASFNGAKIAVGVLQGTGSQASVQFIAGKDNRVYIYRAVDNTTNSSYVVRNVTLRTNYPVYPAGIGTYKAATLVQNAEGQAYACVEPGWCNLRAYGLTSSAWKAVYPKPAPSGYLTYPAGQPYRTNTIVADVEGTLYKCVQAPWCNDKSGAFAPGLGRAWFSAWERQ